MKLIQINTVCNGSTGKIMADIQSKANKDGYDTISFYGRRNGYKSLKCEKIGSNFSFFSHLVLATIFDMQGYGSYFATKKLVRRLKEEQPDIIHLHNVHGYYLHLPTLFKYLKEDYNGEIRWTLHDCWTFTGHCSHFTASNCDKWKTCCYKCPNKRKYPVSLVFDRSKKNYLDKKRMFTGLKNLTIITPSEWLNKLVKKSFLRDYNVVTINNKIDKNIFKRTIDEHVYKKYSIPENKKNILGVASVWTKEKGFFDFIELSKTFLDFNIILVGVNKKQKKLLSKYGIIGVLRTENQTDLAKLYSICDYFVNPTYEDNYPTVNLEAIACGAKVISYDTGGCKEQIRNEDGFIVPVGSIDDIIKIIKEEK